MSADKRIIKIWDARDGSPWTSVEPAVDLNCVIWNRDSGMILTANEGRQQHSFFIPQLGPAPKWCSFLDNLVEEMAEDTEDPAAFAGGSRKVGEVYDDFKFLTVPQLRTLNLDHLIGTTGLLRPYMHGYFVAQRLYEEARLISNPEIWQEQRQKSIREKIDKERESRIRGSKKAAVKVNRQLAERIVEREEKNERRKARRALQRSEALPREEMDDGLKTQEPDQDQPFVEDRTTALNDPRFAALFGDETFAIDEDSNEFRALNASTKRREEEAAAMRSSDPSQRLTAAEMEELESQNGASSENSDSESSGEPHQQRRDRTDIPASNGVDSYRRDKNNRNRQAQAARRAPKMTVTSSNAAVRDVNGSQAQSFGERAANTFDVNRQGKRAGTRGNGEVGERELTFTVQPKQQFKNAPQEDEGPSDRSRKRDRRSASNNVFRRM